MKNKLVGAEVVVSNIPVETDEDELRNLFSVCGTVRSIMRLCDDNGNFYGKAFVRMANNAEAKDAIYSLDGAMLNNRCIEVSAPRKEPTAQTPPPAEKKERPQRRRTGRKKR